MPDPTPTPENAPEPSGSRERGLLASLASRPDLWDLVEAYIDLVRLDADQLEEFERCFPPARVEEHPALRHEALEWLRRAAAHGREV